MIRSYSSLRRSRTVDSPTFWNAYSEKNDVMARMTNTASSSVSTRRHFRSEDPLVQLVAQVAHRRQSDFLERVLRKKRRDGADDEHRQQQREHAPPLPIGRSARTARCAGRAPSTVRLSGTRTPKKTT